MGKSTSASRWLPESDAVVDRIALSCIEQRADGGYWLHHAKAVAIVDRAIRKAGADAAQLASLTKERDELIVNIRTLIMYSHIEPHVEKAYLAKETLRDFILSRQSEGK